MQYEWDSEKRLTNLAKHGMDFAEIDDFAWDSALITLQLRRGEHRFVALGHIRERLHVVVYVHRGANRRIILGRPINLRNDVMLKRSELAEMTFEEIRKLHGEQAAIEAGIVADPDAFELDDEWFEQARPAKEVDPESIEDRPT